MHVGVCHFVQMGWNLMQDSTTFACSDGYFKQESGYTTIPRTHVWH
jgi:hypothetical protein